VLVAARPRQIPSGEDPYGKASIGIYGLNRSGRVRERVALVKRMQRYASIVVRTLRDLTEASGQQADRLQVRLKEDRAELMALTASDQPYAGMAKAFVELFDEELTRHANDAI
jgi:hypothetical protein